MLDHLTECMFRYNGCVINFINKMRVMKTADMKPNVLVYLCACVTINKWFEWKICNMYVQIFIKQPVYELF